MIFREFVTLDLRQESVFGEPSNAGQRNFAAPFEAYLGKWLSALVWRAMGELGLPSAALQESDKSED